MCGITGQINFNKTPVLKKNIQSMTDIIAHRGPDAEGFYIHKNVGFGHRRLSIIDLSDRSNQPMISEDKNYILVFNGEIYNFKYLRNELMKKGMKFKTNSDTEVLLNSLIYYKEKAFYKFNGMFSFAFFDKKEGSLMLGRDRYGIKPLYYHLKDQVLLFSSEIKSFFKSPFFQKSIDLEALYEYFTFQNIISDKNLFKNVRSLPPGCFARVNCYSRNNNSKKFMLWSEWDPPSI